MEKGPIQQLLKSLPKRQKFSEEHLNNLILDYQQTKSAKSIEEIFTLLVKFISKLYHDKRRDRNPYHIYDENEFYSFAYIVLEKCVRNFDITKDVHFTVYFEKLLYGYNSHQIARVRKHEERYIPLDDLGDI